MGSVEGPSVNIVDIRRDKTDGSLLDMVTQALNPTDGSQPSMPTLLLYDEKGLKLFEEITYLEEYYLTNAEIDTLSAHADRIAARIEAGTNLVELGSGNLRKVGILLQAFERAGKRVNYFALDLSLTELQRTFSEIDVSKYHYVSLNALHGTYDDALSWLQQPSNKTGPVCVMTLGSSLGNFSRSEAVEFLTGFKNSLEATDLILVGLDACQDKQRVFTAYNDSKHVTEQFYRNGLDHANRLLGCTVFRQDEWSVEGIYDDVDHKHCASYVALTNVETKHFSIRKGGKVLLEYAYKYSAEQSDKLWHGSGLVSQMTYSNQAGNYNLHLLSPSAIKFSNDPAQYASHPIPSTEDWEKLWSAWDTVTKSMVPRDELLNKPIQLRNNLIFYLGHIPTFADIHFTKATGLKATDPAYYTSIFERGIDPDVDNPEVCHDHSQIPDAWPPLDDILEYSARVRSRIIESIRSGQALEDRKLARGLWLAYEHEAMHLETFLYMLLQSSRVLPPPGEPVPDFEALAEIAAQKREKNKWHDVSRSEISVGLDDPEDNLPPTRFFGWDNERPIRKCQVTGFVAQSRGISNGEYAKFLEMTGSSSIPAGWTTTSHVATETPGEEGEKFLGDPETASMNFIRDKGVRTVYGVVPLKYALDWPVMASYDELETYAKWADARIPTFEEARSIYQFAESQKQLKAAQRSSTLISAVNGHLCNNGVEETPPSNRNVAQTADGACPDPKDLFVDLTRSDVAFKIWHPTAITAEGDRLRGQSETGGLWEWTSSPLADFEGFKAMDLYPGYTADFFDDKHNIILGGSWATVPRIAGRKTFVNWYQRNYPYTWATARLVRDAPV